MSPTCDLQEAFSSSEIPKDQEGHNPGQLQCLIRSASCLENT